MYEKLRQLREELGAESWGELLEKLVSAYEERVEADVRRLMCAELADRGMSLAEWVELLASRLRSRLGLTIAARYLKHSGSALVVDREKCAQ